MERNENECERNCIKDIFKQFKTMKCIRKKSVKPNAI